MDPELQQILYSNGKNSLAATILPSQLFWSNLIPREHSLQRFFAFSTSVNENCALIIEMKNYRN